MRGMEKGGCVGLGFGRTNSTSLIWMNFRDAAPRSLLLISLVHPHIKRLLPHADAVVVAARSEDRAREVPLNPPHVPTMIAKTARERVPRGADLEDADAAVLYIREG